MLHQEQLRRQSPLIVARLSLLKQTVAKLLAGVICFTAIQHATDLKWRIVLATFATSLEVVQITLDTNILAVSLY